MSVILGGGASGDWDGPGPGGGAGGAGRGSSDAWETLSMDGSGPGSVGDLRFANSMDLLGASGSIPPTPTDATATAAAAAAAAAGSFRHRRIKSAQELQAVAAANRASGIEPGGGAPDAAAAAAAAAGASSDGSGAQRLPLQHQRSKSDLGTAAPVAGAPAPAVPAAGTAGKPPLAAPPPSSSAAAAAAAAAAAGKRGGGAALKFPAIRGAPSDTGSDAGSRRSSSGGCDPPPPAMPSLAGSAVVALARGASAGAGEAAPRCGVCLEDVPLVDILRCGHAICVTCARDICRPALLAAALCPFCRAVIGGFRAPQRR
jgi:hypothetical protein